MPAAIILGLILGQAPAEPGESARLARIRAALEKPPAIETIRDVESGDRPVFRLTLRAPKPDRPLWSDWSPVPTYIRPPMPPYHYEFMREVTPEFFRASVLYPGYPMTPYGGLGIAVPVVPLFEASAKAIARLNRRRQQEAAREEVRKALEQLQSAKKGGRRRKRRDVMPVEVL